MLRIILNVVLIFLFVGLEESKLPGRFFLNPYPCLVVFFAFSKDKLSIIWPILGGIILDYFSIFKFPLFTLSLLGTFLIIRFVAERILTFRNFISLIIFSVGGILVYNLIFLILNSITYFLKIENISIIFNRVYFSYFLSNVIFTFLLLFIFRKKYDRSILHYRGK